MDARNLTASVSAFPEGPAMLRQLSRTTNAEEEAPGPQEGQGSATSCPPLGR